MKPNITPPRPRLTRLDIHVSTGFDTPAEALHAASTMQAILEALGQGADVSVNLHTYTDKADVGQALDPAPALEPPTTATESAPPQPSNTKAEDGPESTPTAGPAASDLPPTASADSAAPSPSDEEEGWVPPVEELRAAVAVKMRADPANRGRVTDTLKGFQAASISDIPPRQRAKFLEQLNAL